MRLLAMMMAGPATIEGTTAIDEWNPMTEGKLIMKEEADSETTTGECLRQVMLLLAMMMAGPATIEGTTAIDEWNPMTEGRLIMKEEADSEAMEARSRKIFQKKKEDVYRMRGFFKMIAELLASVRVSGYVNYAACYALILW